MGFLYPYLKGESRNPARSHHDPAKNRSAEGACFGGGTIQDGKFVEGFSHPEMGHMIVRRHPDDQFTGTCPIHKDCLEGVAAGPAIEG